MRRDFTYVDDIVAGIVASMAFCSKRPAVFNLGNNQPVEVMRFITVIEDALGKKGVLTFKNSTSEIEATYADITKAKKLLKFDPKTSIEEGMRNFVAWYKNEPRRHEYATGLFVDPA